MSLSGAFEFTQWTYLTSLAMSDCCPAAVAGKAHHSTASGKRRERCNNRAATMVGRETESTSELEEIKMGRRSNATRVPVRMTLDEMLGVEGDVPFNECTFLARVRKVLSKRTTDDDFEYNFLAFNAISCISDYSPTSHTLDGLDDLLEDYICRCRKASEADFMLCDLIVDHWYPDRVRRLIRALLLKTRYQHRRDQFFRHLTFHHSLQEYPMNAAVSSASIEAAREGIRSENRSVKKSSEQVLELFGGQIP